MSPELEKTDSVFQGLKPSLQKSIKKTLKKENFLQYIVTTKTFNTRGGNVLGKLYEINIKGITSEGEKEINLFVKEKIILKRMKLLNTKQLFTNENYMYMELKHILMSLQEQANIPQYDSFKIAKAYDETNNEIIILENLNEKGFRVYDRAESGSLKFFELGVQELAKFHALSFVIENKMPEYFKEKIAVIEGPFHFDEDWKKMMRKIFRHIADLYDDEIKTKTETFLPVFFDKFPKYQKDKTNICALSHGDYKKNNIMFRMNNGEPVEVITIDYQFINYGCPIRDFLLFIFSGTDRDFRRKHLNDLKMLYFKTLSRFLKYFDMDVETVYPREEFEKVYTEWLDYGLMVMICFSIVLFAPDTGLDIENLKHEDLPFHPDEKFNNTFRELVDDFVQWGYL